jgi:hemerythrin
MDMILAGWSEKIEVGLPTIDSQHKQLFDLAATFAGNGDQIRVMKSLAMLCDYVKTHFLEEEEMMAACGYPELEAHKRLHREFKGMLYKLLENAKHMSLDEIAEEVKQLINGWFYNHILVVDFKYVPSIKAVLKHRSAA